MTVQLTINGKAASLEMPEDTPLLWAIRDELKLTGTKFGCGVASCGACTVMLNGEAVRSCSYTVGDAAGGEVTTIEGLNGPIAEAVQSAWRDLDVVQCGFCQTGQIIQAVSLLDSNPRPDDAAINEGMDGNVCRCGTYGRIKAAVKLAADKLEA